MKTITMIMVSLFATAAMANNHGGKDHKAAAAPAATPALTAEQCKMKENMGKEECMKMNHAGDHADATAPGAKKAKTTK